MEVQAPHGAAGSPPFLLPGPRVQEAWRRARAQAVSVAWQMEDLPLSASARLEQLSMLRPWLWPHQPALSVSVGVAIPMCAEDFGLVRAYTLLHLLSSLSQPCGRWVLFTHSFFQQAFIEHLLCATLCAGGDGNKSRLREGCGLVRCHTTTQGLSQHFARSAVTKYFITNWVT